MSKLIGRPRVGMLNAIECHRMEFIEENEGT